MNEDFYEVLELTRSCTADDVKRAYRIVATKYHPDTHPDNREFCAHKFARLFSSFIFHLTNQSQNKEVSEAYEVLVDSKLRAVYEQYGEGGLRGGISEKLGFKPFVPTSPELIFTRFFGTSNPHSVGIVPSLDELKAAEPPQGLPPTLGTIAVTLEEIFSGCTKRYSFTRKTKTGGSEEKQINVTIPRGIPDRTQLTFKGEGDRGGDLLLVIEQIKHPRFERIGIVDLCHKVKISLAQALLGCIVEVESLDGRKLRIAVNEIVNEGFEKVVPGEGMVLNNNQQKADDFGVETNEKVGDLHIRFKTTFPRTLNDRQRQLLRVALVESEHFAAQPQNTSTNTISP